ncbi:MAG: hypothetical protein H7145_24665 [Akkermansiaceae bacterium]|nr:hypothetical protein [Armatimonadota bacterium]
MSKLNRITRFIAAVTFAFVALAFVLFGVWAFNWESISDDVAYHRLYPGLTRRDVEREIPDWTPRLLYSDGTPGYDSYYATKYPGYCVVRYEWWAGIYVDVYYDAKGRVFMTNCNG